MLRSLHIENFKAFGGKAEIPLAPITLIFGENSAGKSSMLQVLNLLKQTRASKGSRAMLLPRSGLNLVDLGSFREMLFDHDLERELRFRLEFDLEEYRYDSVDTVAIEFLFGRPSLEDEVGLKELSVYHSILHGDPVARFEPVIGIDDEHSEDPMYWDRGLPIPGKQKARAKCTFVTKRQEWWGRFFEEFKKESKTNSEYLRDLLIGLAERRDSLEKFQGSMEKREGEASRDGKRNRSTGKLRNQSGPDNRRRMSDLRRLRHESDRLSQEIERIVDELSFLETEFDLESYALRMSTIELGGLLELDGFLPSDFHSKSAYRGRWSARTSIGRFAVRVASQFETVLDRFFPLGPFRNPPARWYAFAGTSPRDVGYQGQSFPDFLFRNDGAVEQANTWLRKLETGYKLKVTTLSETGELFEIRLQDLERGTKVDVSLMDVGFGISQILPFIVQSLASAKQTISIEQPEIHLHPRLQADLGDLLAEAIKPPLQNQFIVETHSEHLVLRLQRLVRTENLNSEDVSVIYVSRRQNGSEVCQLRLDHEGNFIDNWPGGFFPERIRELL